MKGRQGSERGLQGGGLKALPGCVGATGTEAPHDGALVLGFPASAVSAALAISGL